MSDKFPDVPAEGTSPWQFVRPALSQPILSHAILDRERADLKTIAFGRVGVLGCARGNRSRLLSKSQVGVPAGVGPHHGDISRQSRSDPQLLLCPVDVGQGSATLRLDEATQPDRRTKNEPIIGGLIAPEYEN